MRVIVLIEFDYLTKVQTGILGAYIFKQRAYGHRLEITWNRKGGQNGVEKQNKMIFSIFK